MSKFKPSDEHVNVRQVHDPENNEVYVNLNDVIAFIKKQREKTPDEEVITWMLRAFVKLKNFNKTHGRKK